MLRATAARAARHWFDPCSLGRCAPALQGGLRKALLTTAAPTDEERAEALSRSSVDVEKLFETIDTDGSEQGGHTQCTTHTVHLRLVHC